MRALASLDTDAPPVVRRVGKAVGGTDLAARTVLDAVALAYTASWEPTATLVTLPTRPGSRRGR